ncbi:hypothetical protein [Streptomyces sp. NBC_01565]|uniref:hypothetical protein n=1 Tax=Streptomyces sp. NBC_01565 TaxID=2975881 RepID=UPI0022553D6D|nr:hypothetical protein [Streptomyces sp. NBC_01565]MCX4540475.1 hypothetical protein [Streptomyces sp. NBC_01565]
MALSNERREAIAAWLTANDIDPADIPLDGRIIEDQTAGVIRYEVVIRDLPSGGILTERLPGGQRVISPPPPHPWRETREAPLLVPAPDRFPA